MKLLKKWSVNQMFKAFMVILAILISLLVAYLMGYLAGRNDAMTDVQVLFARWLDGGDPHDQ